MAKLQKQFEKFHDEIKLDAENEILRARRDTLLDRIRNHLRANGRPGFDPLLQGSYAMHVGVKPVGNDDVDIDVGLRFGIRPEDYTATEVRGWILEAVQGHTKRVEDRGPCVRVVYDDEYHVDLVVYANWTGYGQERFRLAHRKRGWVDADPKGLLAYVEAARGRFKGTEDSATQTDQMRRVIRYLKRWNDLRIRGESDQKPCGLVFVLMCTDRLLPATDIVGDPDDLVALRDLGAQAGGVPGRIIVKKPTPEHEDLLARLSDRSMEQLKAAFIELAHELESARRIADTSRAAELIEAVLGVDFPIPPRAATAIATGSPAIVTSSSSA